MLAPDCPAAEPSADRLAVIRQIVTGYGSPPPVTIWEPRPEDLPAPLLPRLLRDWRRLCAEAGGLPHFRRIDPAAFRYALGHLVVLEALGDGADFRYRLYGTVLVERYRRDLTGTRLSEHSARFRDLFLAGYRAVHEQRRPLFTAHVPPPEVSIRTLSRLILPFADDRGAVARLLVGSVPGDRRMGV